MDQRQFEQRFRQVVARLNQWHKGRETPPIPQPAAQPVAPPDAAHRASGTRPGAIRAR